MRNAQRILDSVIEISASRDAQQFRRTLGVTIREMLAVEGIAFVRPRSAPQDPLDDAAVVHVEAARPAATTALHKDLQNPEGPLATHNVLEMIHAGEYVHREANAELLMLPVFHKDQLAEIIVVKGQRLPHEARYLLKGYVRLYGNFLGLLIEGQTDALTGLLSRKSLETELTSVIEDAKLAHRHATRRANDQRDHSEAIGSYLAVIDIDHFKRINDTLGHLFGDEVIILVARLMKEVFRTRDLLFRFGGEEFVVVLLSDSRNGVRAALERFRARVEANRFPQLTELTVSIGFAEVNGDLAPSAVLGMADQALYYAKDHGRNRVCEYEDLISTGELSAPDAQSSVDLF